MNTKTTKDTAASRSVITFDDSAKRFILSSFGKDVDAEGYIVEKSDPKQRVLTLDGSEVLESEFAGLHRGSLVFVKSDLVSVIRLMDRLG